MPVCANCQWHLQIARISQSSSLIRPQKCAEIPLSQKNHFSAQMLCAYPSNNVIEELGLECVQT